MTPAEAATRIAALEAAVDELRRELARASKPIMRSMRLTRRCPACGGNRILHFTKIQDVGSNGFVDLTLQKRYSIWTGLKDPGGALEAYACRGCRLVEWHAVTLDDVKPDGKLVIELEPTEEPDPPASPYR